MQLGGSFAGNSSRRHTTSPRSLKFKTKTNNNKPKSLGLRCPETWQLSGCEAYLKGSQIRNEGRQLCLPPNRRTHLDKVSSDEERGIVRASCQIDEGRKKFRRIGRSSSRYDCSELTKAKEIRSISDVEEEEISFQKSQQMDTLGHWSTKPGFSDTGDLAEQQLTPWIPKTFQTETALAVGEFQSWEDFDDTETNQLFSDLYDSDGRTSS